ncbi:MAG TPA: aminotransferase class IV, partial [Candidatus Atribacteria bacterium]|nr:aminotransferase class IV [Candidatus Atribacteria bacterium]
MQELEKIWMNGELLPWKEAKVHVLTHALHYGTAIFEGIRCYKTNTGPAIFRLSDHLERLYNSAHIVRMTIPYSPKEIERGIIDTIKANEVEECYIRPIVFRGYGEMGVDPSSCSVDCAIAVWCWGAYMGEKGIEEGIRAKISS